jgi:hypothetical protein
VDGQLGRRVQRLDRDEPPPVRLGGRRDAGHEASVVGAADERRQHPDRPGVTHVRSIGRGAPNLSDDQRSLCHTVRSSQPSPLSSYIRFSKTPLSSLS